jgi:hypothetical protein
MHLRHGNQHRQCDSRRLRRQSILTNDGPAKGLSILDMSTFFVGKRLGRDCIMVVVVVVVHS